MKIAIHCADLDHSRIDGTRVYILNMLKNFGVLAPHDRFFLYHKNEFNPELAPPVFDNYAIRKCDFPAMWTQTRFAFELWRDRPDVLWMPMHNIPLLRRRDLKTVVTIHDLAFKRFPQYFPPGDLRKLNALADHCMANATKLIAISESTKKDILEFYPERMGADIKVIHHGFDCDLFEKKMKVGFEEEILSSHGLKPKTYLLYVGAIQPRKNLGVLIKAFEKISKSNLDLKLVIAGEKAWMWEDTFKLIESSSVRERIIVTGKVAFEQLPVLYRNAAAFVFPEMYAGFGIPILEAFASAVPVIAARNSSLTEIGGDAALYFETSDSDDLYEKISLVLSDWKIAEKMIEAGKYRLQNFSWDKCAQETLEWLMH